MNSWGDLLSPQTPLASPIGEMICCTPTMPGRGTPGPDCQSKMPYHCNTCGASFIISSSCMLRTCPNCYTKWASKEAKRAGLRLWAGAQLRTGRKTGYRLLHCVVSLPHADNLPKQRKICRETAKAHGISGGIAIWHPFRQPEDKKWIQDGYDHFHVLGLAKGDVKPGTDEKTVFRVIRDAKRKDYRGFQRVSEIKACLFYILTHCGILKGRSSVSWFGELSYNQLSNHALLSAIPGLSDEFNSKQKRLCPFCRSEDIEPDWYTDYTDFMNPCIISNDYQRCKPG